MEDGLREQETCFDVMESSISECVLDLVNTVVNQELENNQTPTSDKSDVILKPNSQQQQSIPVLVDHEVKDPVYRKIEKQDDLATEEKSDLKETNRSVKNLDLLFEAVLSEILDLDVMPTTPEEENVSTKSDSMHQDDGDKRNLSTFNDSDNHGIEENTTDEKAECPLDGLRSLLKTVPFIKLPPVPEPSPPSPSVTPEMKDEGREVKQKEKKPVDYLQVLRILRKLPPQMESENTENGATDVVSDGPNGNEEEEALTARKKARSVVVASTEVSPVKIPDKMENGEDQESTNSDSTIFIAKTRRQSKKNHSEKETPVLETYTPISTDSEKEEIKKQKKEKAIKKKAKIRMDEADRNDSKSNLYSKKEVAKPLAIAKEPILRLKNPKIILYRCDDLVRSLRKRKRSESHSSASQPSPEKVNVGKDRNCTTNSHSTILMSSVLKELGKDHSKKVKAASVTTPSPESETGAAKKQKKEEPMKKKIKREKDDTSSKTTICLSKEQLMQKRENDIFASKLNGEDFRTFVVLEKGIEQNWKKSKKSTTKNEMCVGKRQKISKEMVDNIYDSDTSSGESLFSIVTPLNSSFIGKDRLSGCTSTSSSKFLFSPVKKKQVAAIENTVEQKHVKETETREKERKGSTKLEESSSRFKEKKGKKSVDVDGQKRKRSSSPEPSSTENSDAALLKKWSLKPCHVVLRRIKKDDPLKNSSLKKKREPKKIEQSTEPEVTPAKRKKHLKKMDSVSPSPKKSRKPHTCEFCGKVFQHASAKKIHVENHFVTTKYKCSICKKGFPMKAGLQLHMQIKHKLKME